MNIVRDSVSGHVDNDSVMKKCMLLLVLVLTVLSKNVANANLCESNCECQPSRAPTTVKCRCDWDTKVLTFTQEQLTSNFRDTTNFTIYDCDGSVNFTKNAFRHLGQLKDLVITNVKEVTFKTGVFQNLKHLTLHDIKSLNFEDSAFMSALLETVEIRNSTIDKLLKYSLYNLNSLSKFIMDGIHIRSINKQAIKLKDNGDVHIIKSKIDYFEEESLVIDADTVVLYNSTIKGISDDAVNITAKTQLVISKNQFDEHLPNRPIHAKAPIVNISNNHFKFINSEILRNIQSDSEASILFKSNKIDEFGQNLDHIPSTWNVQGNLFVCNCQLMERLKNLKESEALKRNYCMTKCLLPLIVAAEKCYTTPSSALDFEDLCEGMTTIETSSDSSRDGRGIHYTSEMPPNSTAHHALIIPLLVVWSIIIAGTFV